MLQETCLLSLDLPSPVVETVGTKEGWPADVLNIVSVHYFVLRPVSISKASSSRTAPQTASGIESSFSIER